MAIRIPIISEFDGAGLAKAQKEFQSLEGAGAKAGFALNKAFVPAVAILGGLTAGLGLATKAAAEDQKAQDLLAQQLRTSAMATDDVIKSNVTVSKSVPVAALMSRAVAISSCDISTDPVALTKFAKAGRSWSSATAKV